MVKILGAKSGFKNVRDILLFAVGVGILVWYLHGTPAKDVQVPILLLCVGIMGSPYVLNRDEQRNKE